MKKILTVLTLLSAFLLTACGPSYDYSSPKKLQDSLMKQAKEEKLSEDEAIQILSAYVITVALENAELVVDDVVSKVLTADSVKDLLDEVAGVESLKPLIEGKTFEDMKDDASPILLKLIKNPNKFSRNLEEAFEKGLK